MVTATLALDRFLVLADQAGRSGFERLDPPTRARVVMALLGLVLLGVVLVGCVMLGGRWVRRLARHVPRSTTLLNAATRRATTSPPTDHVAITTGDTLAHKHLTDETLTD